MVEAANHVADILSPPHASGR